MIRAVLGSVLAVAVFAAVAFGLYVLTVLVMFATTDF